MTSPVVGLRRSSKALPKTKLAPQKDHGHCLVVCWPSDTLLLLLLLLSRFSRVRFPRPWDSPGKNTGVGCHFLLQCMKVKVKPLSHVRLLATRWTTAYQAPLSKGFSRQEYWNGLPLPSPIWYTTAFWIPAKPLHLRSMASKSIRCTENCNTCGWHWSTERTQFFPTTTREHMLHYQHFKSWTNWAMKFCPICHIHLTYHQPTTISSIKTTFLQGKFFCNQKQAENAFQGLTESQSKYFYATGINKLISCWQKMCWLHWFLFWLIKMYLSLVIMI